MNAVARESRVDEGRCELVTCLVESGCRGCDGFAAGVDRDPRHARHVETLGPLLRRQVRDRGGHSVVRMLSDDRAVTSGDAGRDPPCDVIRLASRIDEHDGVESGFRRHRGEQALRELDERLVDVASMRVQRTRLAYDRLCHPRVRMTDDRHVVVRVEQTPAVDVDEPHPLPARDMDGIGVRELSEHRAERVRTSLDQRVRRCRWSRSAELLRETLGADVADELEQAPGILVPGLDVLRILGVPRDTPGADHDDRGEPRRNEVAEDVELLGLERNARLVAVGRDTGNAEDVVERASADQ